jgi:hypothetical protein
MNSLSKYLIALAMLIAIAGHSEDRIEPGSRQLTEIEKQEILYFQEKEKLECPCKKKIFEKDKINLFEEKGKLECPCKKKKQNLSLVDRYPPLLFDSLNHNLVAISALKDYIVIEDGSQWKINPAFLSELSNWKENDPILLTKNDSFFTSWFSDYNYRMYNVKRETYVEVNIDLGPILENPHTLQVVAIKPNENQIILSDSSLWQLDPSKESILQKWQIKDGIILGKPSSSWFYSKYDTFLLNVETLLEIKAKRIQ